MITIVNDDIVLTGGSVLTADTENSAVRYIVFTATSVSETSGLNVTITPEDASSTWGASVTLVKCTNDESGKTYAIRIECPFFSVASQEEKVRKVKVDGVVYTNLPSVYSPVHETFTVSGCVDWNT